MEDLTSSGELGHVKPVSPGRLVGLQGRLDRPFWGVMGIWAVLCGALASRHLRWEGDALLVLALALLLADLAWGTLWDLGAGTDWFGSLAGAWPSTVPDCLPVLPYTQPDAPAGRLFRGLGRLVTWWRGAFWPAAGSALLGLLAAILLSIALALLLPDRLRLLGALLVALVGLGMIWRRRGKVLLAGEALTQVALGWLAGHLALAEMTAASLLLALAFAVAVWGSLRVEQGLPRGLWLLNGGLVVVVGLLIASRQPLAAGLAGLLFFGQVAVQLALRLGREPGPSVRRAWPWLMAIMPLAALALP